MRAVIIMVWILAVLVLLLPLLRRAMSPAQRAELPRDELVKDPVCNTYVARSRAVRRADAAGFRYFCSAECARRFLTGA